MTREVTEVPIGGLGAEKSVTPEERLRDAVEILCQVVLTLVVDDPPLRQLIAEARKKIRIV